MFKKIRADIVRYQRHDERNPLRIIWESPGLKTTIIYRLGRWLQSIGMSPLRWPLFLLLSPVYLLLVTYMRIACDIILELSADIGPGFYIGHFGGIRIKDCYVGANCSIQQEVSLLPYEGKHSGPVVGNFVWIGTHVCLQGPISIGDRATIGAGAVVTQNVEANCLVLGNPARVLQRDYDNSSIL